MRGNFEKFYNQLNLEQKEAVDTLEGPVMVVAGPGTGKTQVLTLRIANTILQGKARPEEILALTFTENAAFNMKRRLFSILGPAAYRARIATFHSFCNDIILENPEDFSFVKSAEGLYGGAQNISEVEQAKFIEKIFQHGKFEYLNINNPFVNYIAELSRAISNFKREGILPEDYRKIIDREEEYVSLADDLYHDKGAYKGKMKAVYRDRLEQIAKNREICEVYAKYQEALENSGRYDYDDMILFVLRVLRPRGGAIAPTYLLERLQDQFRYILVDEHQDANSAQNEVVELLGRKHKNIFAVGDEKQSIFRFQGASLENILYFKKRFPDCRIITLEKNYRSGQLIIDCAQSVIANNSLRLANYLGDISDRLISNREADPPPSVCVLEAENQDDECCFIVRKIKKLSEGGVALGEIAVLYRDNWEGLEIAAALEKAGMAYCIESNRNVFEDRTIQGFINFLKFVSREDLSVFAFQRGEIDEELIKILFADFLRISAIDVYKLADLRASLPRRKSLFAALCENEKFCGVAETIGKCTEFARQKNAPQAFEAIAKKSGFLTYIISLNSQDAVSRFKTLFDELKAAVQGKLDYTLNDFVEHLDLLCKYRIALNQKAVRIPLDAVRLMTAHKAKGLEFDYVIISGCSDARWGGRKRPDVLKLLRLADFSAAPDEVEIEDARRLFYVALTRAKKGVFAVCALHNFDGRSLLPSRFLNEIKPELVTHLQPTDHAAGAVSEIMMAPHERADGGKMGDSLLIQDAEYLHALFLKRGFAATHLNNYLDCPWKYFFRNLIRLPEAQAPHLMYGNAVHFALKKFFDNREYIRLEYLISEFVRTLERQPLRAYEFEKYRERGERTLAGYFDYYNLSVQGGTKTINEFNVGNVMLDGEVRLTGKIDKIELLGGEANVVDYKTGRRKTRNEILGQTKNSKGNEYRQLVFYKLLLDKMPASPAGGPNLPYRMTSGEIDFVEPEKRTGKFYKEKFFISDDAVRKLEYQIQDVVAEILGLAFWDRRCSDNKCAYCKLREQIK